MEIIEVMNSNIRGEKDNIITIQIEEKQLSYIEFAKLIDNTLINNFNIIFIIGGSDGLDDEIKSLSNYKLSFSNIAFLHQLFRVILSEQIYRAFKKQIMINLIICILIIINLWLIMKIL